MGGYAAFSFPFKESSNESLSVTPSALSPPIELGLERQTLSLCRSWKSAQRLAQLSSL
jgi:hypothetical protein